MKPSFTLSLSESSILNRIKESYLLYLSIIPHIPKSSRYTLGSRIENKFLDLLEISYTAYFTKEGKAEKISRCIFTLDIIKFLISISWEGKIISNKHYENLALKLSEIGKMLWGWRKHADNLQEKPPKFSGEKI